MLLWTGLAFFIWGGSSGKNAFAKDCPTRVLKEYTVSGILRLKGETRKNRCLLTIVRGRHMENVVADRDVLRRAMAGGIRNGSQVTVRVVRKQIPVDGFCFAVNFFQGFGGQTQDAPEGELLDFLYIFNKKSNVRAYACAKGLTAGRHAFADVKRACARRDTRRALTLSDNGKGVYTPDGGVTLLPFTWYQNEFHEWAVNITIDGKLHIYNIYDGHYMEGADGPSDGLPSALVLEEE